MTHRYMGVQAGGSRGAGGAAARQLQRVNDAIEAGGWWEQFGAIALLRLTPVVPFRRAQAQALRSPLEREQLQQHARSSTPTPNILNLFVLRCAPHIAGTLPGKAVWSTISAPLGATSLLFQVNILPEVSVLRATRATTFLACHRCPSRCASPARWPLWLSGPAYMHHWAASPCYELMFDVTLEVPVVRAVRATTCWACRRCALRRTSPARWPAWRFGPRSTRRWAAPAAHCCSRVLSPMCCWLVRSNSVF